MEPIKYCTVHKRVEIRYILQKTKVLPINEKNKPLHYYSPMQKIVKTSAVKQSFFGSAPAPSLQKIIQNVNNNPLQLIFQISLVDKKLLMFICYGKFSI